MKKILTIFVILAFAVMAMSQTGGQNGVDKNVGGVTTGGGQGIGDLDEKAKPPVNRSLQPGTSGQNPLDPNAGNSGALAGPKGDKGDPGEPGVPGRNGRNGKNGRTVFVHRYYNSAGIYSEFNSHWDLATKKDIDAKIALNNQWNAVKAFIAPLPARGATAGSPAKTDSNASQSSAEGPEESGMDWEGVLLIVVAALVVGGTICWWWGALVYRRRGLDDQNHRQTGKFTPDKKKWGEFEDETTLTSHSRRGVSEKVALARADTQARVAEARADETIAREVARAQRRDNLMQMLVQPAVPAQLVMAGGGYALGLPQGGSGATPATETERKYGIEELKKLGVIRPPAPAKEAEKPKDEEAAKKKPAAAKT